MTNPNHFRGFLRLKCRNVEDTNGKTKPKPKLKTNKQTKTSMP